ncbi:MAG: hypothetical protein HQL38_02400 [Alphaproteobacteria bacterium]|nr:hypothetical protein [Alphaproteobacteria bacterium]MBF0391508.1 hypothetical protein [Alphaproteobacteria bacterium]
MVLRFVVDPNVFNFVNNEEIQSASHLRLMSLWEKLGVLSLSSCHHEMDDYLRGLPQQIKKAWQVALTTERYRKCDSLNTKLVDMMTSCELLMSNSSLIDVAFLEETRAARFGVNDGELCTVVEDGVELTRFDCCDQSRKFQELAQLWERPVTISESREQVWETRFRAIATYSRRISIVDRYSLLHLHSRHQSGEVSGLEIFLRKLSRCAGGPKKTVNVYGSSKDVKESDAENTLRRVTSGMNSGSIASLHLHVCRDRIFSKVAHDRYIRFDGVATAMGAGVSLFQNEPIRENYLLGLMVDRSDLLKNNIEEELRRSSTRYKII